MNNMNNDKIKIGLNLFIYSSSFLELRLYPNIINNKIIAKTTIPYIKLSSDNTFLTFLLSSYIMFDDWAAEPASLPPAPELEEDPRSPSEPWFE